MSMIGYPPTKELTQGIIFSCAASEDYTDVPVFGLIITARCDVAHGKAPVISYVPLVNFRAWLFRDGLRLLASRVLADSRGQMKSALRASGLAESLVDTLSPQSLHDYLAQVTGKAERTAAQRYIDAEGVKRRVEAALGASPGTKLAEDFLDAQPKGYQRLLEELLSNGVSDYHFIERCEPDEVCEGYVALLREIRYLPAALADSLKSGIDFAVFEELCSNKPQYVDKLSITTVEHYALPVGIVQSPFIELLMQRFTNLYSRIGVTDFSPDVMKSLRGIVPFNTGKTP